MVLCRARCRPQRPLGVRQYVCVVYVTVSLSLSLLSILYLLFVRRSVCAVSVPAYLTHRNIPKYVLNRQVLRGRS